MTRRPDERTQRQREDAQRAKIAEATAVVLSWEGSQRRDIREVYVQEIRRGTRCKVLTSSRGSQ